MSTSQPAVNSSDKLPHLADASNAADPALTASCHCGRVTIQLPSAPTKINECRCSVCYSYGALWAYYPRRDVVVTVAATDKRTGQLSYVRDDAGGNIEFVCCGHCGNLTHWGNLKDWQSITGKNTGEDVIMGVNTRMMPEKAIEGVERKVTYL